MNEDSFSLREQDVIALLMQGKSNKEITQALGIANRTVESHLSRIYAKLNVASRTEAALKMSENHSWKSTNKLISTDQGNPQLNQSDKVVILNKTLYHSYRLRRKSMKTLVRILILILVTILIITLIFGAFALRRFPVTAFLFSIFNTFI